MDERMPYVVVLTIRIIYVGMFIFSKAAFNGGTNSFVFVFYRQAFATIFLVPLALIFERKNAPPLSLVTFCKIFMLSLLGITATLNIFNIALIYTSATLAAASINSVPVITFFLAVLLRMETVNWRSLSGASKIFGVMACSAGVATIALYKGPHLKPLVHHPLFGYRSGEGQVDAFSSKTWIKGSFLMLASNILWGFWLVLQGKVIKCYPSKLLFTTLQCFLRTIQSFFVAIVIERNSHAWKLRLDVGLLAVAYCGIMVTGVSFYLQAWCIAKKGPVFLSISTPLGFILTMLCSVLFLGESICMGSVLGGIFLVVGLYGVLWGKSKEESELKLTIKGGDNEELNNVNFVSEDKKRNEEVV